MVTKVNNFLVNVDSVTLIQEVENRPAIWNPLEDSYCDRLERAKLWIEVANSFKVHGMTNTDEKLLVLCLQKKWRNIRDQYLKERRAYRSKPGKKQEYVYYKQLRFLEPIIIMKTKEKRLAKANENLAKKKKYEEVGRDLNESSDGDETHAPPPRRKIKKKYSDPPKITTVIARKNKTHYRENNTQAQEEDPDRCFMLSLLDDFKRLPATSKPHVKINLMKCIMEAQLDEPEIYSNIQRSDSKDNIALEVDVSPTNSETSEDSSEEDRKPLFLEIESRES